MAVLCVDKTYKLNAIDNTSTTNRKSPTICKISSIITYHQVAKNVVNQSKIFGANHGHGRDTGLSRSSSALIRQIDPFHQMYVREQSTDIYISIQRYHNHTLQNAVMLSGLLWFDITCAWNGMNNMNFVYIHCQLLRLFTLCGWVITFVSCCNKYSSQKFHSVASTWRTKQSPEERSKYKLCYLMTRHKQPSEEIIVCKMRSDKLEASWWDSKNDVWCDGRHKVDRPVVAFQDGTWIS
jgi:hypothetical protein